MRKLKLRTGYDPPAHSIVVRGGDINPEELINDARKCMKQWGVLGVSMAIADVPALPDLMGRVTLYVAKMPLVSVSNVGLLSGYQLLATFQAPHYSLVLPSLDVVQLQHLCHLFEVVDNPLLQNP